VPQRTIDAHTGWRRCDERLIYLHADGGIGPDGLVQGIAVALPGELSRFRLPDPPSADALTSGIRGSLAMIAVAPVTALVTPRVVIPIHCGRFIDNTAGPDDVVAA
jgi:hypothetical protein